MARLKEEAEEQRRFEREEEALRRMHRPRGMAAPPKGAPSMLARARSGPRAAVVAQEERLNMQQAQGTALARHGSANGRMGSGGGGTRRNHGLPSGWKPVPKGYQVVGGQLGSGGVLVRQRSRPQADCAVEQAGGISITTAGANRKGSSSGLAIQGGNLSGGQAGKPSGAGRLAMMNS